MIYEPIYFELHELVCQHVFNKYGETAWSFLDPRLLKTLDVIRERIGKVITVNTWKKGGQFDERGFRCIQCELVQNAIDEKRLYVSPHMTGQAVDFDVQGLVAEEVRQWLISNKAILPFGIRMEKGVSWVHLDVREGKEKVVLFNP
jgi:hypothetical protein